MGAADRPLRRGLQPIVVTLAGLVRGRSWEDYRGWLGTWTKALPFCPVASAQARQLIAEVLGSWGLDHVASTAQQCASELVTDALQRGSPPVHLVIKRWTDAVQVSVIDPNEPRQDDGASGAYGERSPRRRMLEGLVGGWGVEAVSGGQAASFDIAVAPARS